MLLALLQLNTRLHRILVLQIGADGQKNTAKVKKTMTYLHLDRK